jgi:hypothetical protein
VIAIIDNVLGPDRPTQEEEDNKSSSSVARSPRSPRSSEFREAEPKEGGEEDIEEWVARVTPARALRLSRYPSTSLLEA